jgi:hypothetical protein
MHPPRPRFFVLALACSLLALCAVAPGFAEELIVTPAPASALVPVPASAAPAPELEPDIASAKRRIDDFTRKMDAKLREDVDSRLDFLPGSHYEAEGQWLAQHYFELSTIKRNETASPAR